MVSDDVKSQQIEKGDLLSNYRVQYFTQPYSHRPPTQARGLKPRCQDTRDHQDKHGPRFKANNTQSYPGEGSQRLASGEFPEGL